jgi:hypothetical protein
MAVVGVTVWVMLPGLIDLGVVRIANPAGVAALGDPAVHALGAIPGLLAFRTLFVGSVALRHGPVCAALAAGPIERQQLKWLAFVAGGSGLAGATGSCWPALATASWPS